LKKLVIFDLDGTLLDTIGDLCASVNHALGTERLPLRSLCEVRSFVGNGIRNLVERSVPQGMQADTLERVFCAFKSHYAENCEVNTVPYEGITELLSKLKAEGYLLGVVSNKADSAVKTLIEHYFPSTFDSVIGERAGVRRKPAPDSVLETVNALGADIKQTVYIGDSEVDAVTAENAGCDCVLVSWGFRERALLESFNKPLADSADELYDLIKTSEIL